MRGRYTLDDVRRAITQRHRPLVARARPIGVEGEARAPGVYWRDGRPTVVFHPDRPPGDLELLRHFPHGPPVLIGGEARPDLL